MTTDRAQVADAFLADLLVGQDDALAAALSNNAASGLPPIDVSPLQGKFLHILARAIGAKSILEIGTLGGYSAIWLARALGPGGKLVTLELDPRHADVARTNLDRAGVGHAVDIRVGKAADSLHALISEKGAPFDLVFIDADKVSIPLYLELSLQLVRPGSIILCDNVVRKGEVADAASTDPSVQGVRTFLQHVATNPKLTVTAIQTVGAKGHDGFAIALVN